MNSRNLKLVFGTFLTVFFSSVSSIANATCTTYTTNQTNGVTLTNGSILCFTVNSGVSLTSAGGTGFGNYNGGGYTGVTLLNNGTITGGAGFGAVLNQGITASIGITNNNLINDLSTAGNAYGIANATSATMSITNNAGATIRTNGNQAVYNSGGTISSINNYGTINATNSMAIGNLSGSTINSIVNNAGATISINNNATSTYAIYNSGTIGTFVNNGTVSTGGGGAYTMMNAGTLTELDNAQGAANSAQAFSIRTQLPTNYNVIINGGTSNYGQLTYIVNGGQNSTTFGIYSGSTLAAGTYSNVLSGLTSSNITNYASIYNTWTNYNSTYKWELVAGSASNTWDLIVALRATNITGNGTVYQTSNLGGSVLPKFDGGTLQAASAGSITGNFTVTSNYGKIDQNGLVTNFIGNISDDSAGVHGKVTIINTGAAGLGSVTLSGVNTHSGGTEVDAGANLSIANSSALGTGGLALVGSSTVPAVLSTTADMTISNPITVSGDPTFNVASGTTTTVSSGITDGVVNGSTVAGDVVVDGGGTLALTAVNTYTGATTVNAGSTLALSGSGSIATSTAVTNNGTLDITGKSGNVALGGTYTQGSAGTLAMNFSPTNNQQLNATGAVSLGGALSLTASSGTYLLGRYTLLTGSSVTGTFASLSTNLGAYTGAAYRLTYDASDVYLVISPSSSDTQSSLQLSANALQSIYALQTSAITSGLSYDCTVFDKDGICVSTGGRYSRVNTGNTQTSNGLLIGAYRLSNQVRLGAWLDQNLSSNTATGVNLNNGSPMFGVYGVWNEQPTGNGFEVKVSAGYGNRDLSVTRQVVGSSEAGTGTTQLNAQGISAVVSYNLPINTMWTASPYLGLRYTKVGASGYTETSGASSAPLTYNALNQESKTALAGLKMSGRMSADCGVFASVGVEQDLTNNGGDYTASGNQLTLTTIALSPTIKRTRGAVSAGTYYDVDKAQRISLSAMYREEAFVATNTLSTMLMYTAGF